MPELSIFRSPAPYHIITYGTLLGTQFFQSFIAGIISYRALTRPQFSQLQQRIFPIYFSLQTFLPAILALTYPGSRLLNSNTPSSISGVLAEGNRWSVLAPIATVLITSAVNMVLVGPATTRLMLERKVQETRDGKKSYDSAPHSKEMQRLNSRFARMHGVSSLLNLAGFFATVWYGVSLSERIV